MEAAATDTSKEAQLRHRYEMAHEKSLRSAIRGLLALEKSRRADLAGRDAADPGPEPVAPAESPPEAPGNLPKSDSPGPVASPAAIGHGGFGRRRRPRVDPEPPRDADARPDDPSPGRRGGLRGRIDVLKSINVDRKESPRPPAAPAPRAEARRKAGPVLSGRGKEGAMARVASRNEPGIGPDDPSAEVAGAG